MLKITIDTIQQISMTLPTLHQQRFFIHINFMYIVNIQLKKKITSNALYIDITTNVRNK